MKAVKIIEAELRDHEVPMSDALALALDEIELVATQSKTCANCARRGWGHCMLSGGLGHNASHEQTRLGSLIESLMNITIGYCVALLSQISIFPMFGIHVPLSTNLWIGAWFTAISLVRSYIIRRWFNARLHSAAQAMARAAS